MDRMAGNEWRCRWHPAALPCGGVCPHCLRDRLLRLCPDCASCPCACASPSSSSSGSALGRVHSLIERDHRDARSRSLVMSGGGDDQVRPPKSRVWGWASFRKPAEEAAGCRDVEEEYDDAVALARSRSVSTAAAAAKGASKASGWGRLIPGKIKALRRQKSSVVR